MIVFVVYFILVFLYIFGIAKVKKARNFGAKFLIFVILEREELSDSVPLLRLLRHVDVLHPRHRRSLPRELCAREELLDFRVHQNLPGDLQLFAVQEDGRRFLLHARGSAAAAELTEDVR